MNSIHKEILELSYALLQKTESDCRAIEMATQIKIAEKLDVISEHIVELTVLLSQKL